MNNTLFFTYKCSALYNSFKCGTKRHTGAMVVHGAILHSGVTFARIFLRHRGVEMRKKARNISMRFAPWWAAVWVGEPKAAMFAVPVVLRVPIQPFRKITSGRRERSAWLLVGGPGADPAPQHARALSIALQARWAVARH